MTKLERLPDDIYELFNPDTHHEVNQDSLNLMLNNLKELINERLSKQEETSDRAIRFSALGKGNRQVWYDAHPEPDQKERMSPQTYLKFMYGAIIEELVLFLTREAGHTVEKEQAQVEIDGVTGSLDAFVDDVVVDVKSASPYGFKKFKYNSVLEDDPFGYVHQLAGYSSIANPGKDAAWIAFDKVSGEICVSPLKASTMQYYLPEPRIKQLKEIVASDTPPERCYPDLPDGKSGNMKLGTECSYCAHKKRCWPELRTFLYSGSPRFLTRVARVPNVMEV